MPGVSINASPHSEPGLFALTEVRYNRDLDLGSRDCYLSALPLSYPIYPLIGVHFCTSSKMGVLENVCGGKWTEHKADNFESFMKALGLY